jgi:hypothetical protein
LFVACGSEKYREKRFEKTGRDVHDEFAISNEIQTNI